MMDHLEDKPRDRHWDVTQHNIVRFLLEKWSLSDAGFTEEEVNHVIGSLEVNAFEVTSPDCGRGRGVYPLTSLMSHNCISNARYIIHDDFHVEVRATTAIKTGQEITDHYVTPLNGTAYRRTHLKDGWFFDCECDRCRDPTEASTLCSAFLCPKCQGPVLPVDPLNRLSDWRCRKCDHSQDWETLSQIENELSLKLDDNENDIKCNVEVLENVLNEAARVLYPTHYLIIAIKRYLLYGYSPVDAKLLAKKLSFARDILSQYDVLCPGTTRERGLTLFEVFRANFQLAKLEFKMEGDQMSLAEEKQQQVMDRLSRCQNDVREAIRCLRFEKPGSFEHMIRRAAEHGQKEASDIYQALKSM